MSTANVIPFDKRLKRKSKATHSAFPGSAIVIQCLKLALLPIVRVLLWISTFTPLAVGYIILHFIVLVGSFICRIVIGMAALCIFGSLGLGLIVLFGHMKLSGPAWVNFWAVHAEFWGLLIVAVLLELGLQVGKDWYLHQAIQIRRGIFSSRLCDKMFPHNVSAKGACYGKNR